MGSVADVFDAIVPPAPPVPQAVPVEPKPDRPVPVGEGDAAGPRVGRLAASALWTRKAGYRVREDWRTAWLWNENALTLRVLWQARIPDRAAVPAGNRGLWIAWCAYNHAVLFCVLGPLLFTAWLLGHPGRLLYLAPFAVTVAALWLT